MSETWEVGAKYSLLGETMGTTWAVKLFAASSVSETELQGTIQATLDQVVAHMSPWDAQSALSRFNAAPAGSWCRLPHELFVVLEFALCVARSSNGAFDPTVGALVNAWGFGPQPSRGRIPSAGEISQAAARCGWSRIEIDLERRAAMQPGSICLDLCGIAKGFGVDQVARHLKKVGVRDFLVEIGGELRGEGVKPDGTPWWVACEQPPDDDGEVACCVDAVVALHGALHCYLG